MKTAAAIACALLLAACTQTPTKQTAGPPSPSGTASQAAQPSPSASPQGSLPHVFVIVLENRSAAQVAGSSYIGQLASQYAVANNYHGVSHPSLPNYLALTSGSTWAIADDGWHSLPAGGLGAQLTAAGVGWRAYMEGMTNGCFNSPYPYALKHNPFAYYGGTCPAQVVPFSRFASDMSGVVPNFVWITPDLCHDGHDCSNATVNSWLSQTVPIILNSKAWQQDGVLFITWDEGEDSGNTVLTLVVHPRPILHQSAQAYNHYSLLATIEDTLRVPRLGEAAQAAPMSGLMASWPLLP
jgi:phosphatidylinositol-3-phosphatase